MVRDSEYKLSGKMTLWQLELGITQEAVKKDSDSDQSDLVFKVSFSLFAGQNRKEQQQLQTGAKLY